MATSTEKLALHFDVCNLISRYAQALDSGQVDETVAMFTDEGVFAAAVGGTMTGHDELRQYYGSQQTEPEWDAFRGGQHLNTNTVITSVTGDRVEASTDFIYVVPTADGPKIIFLGRYHDVIQRDDDELKFVLRTVLQNPGLPG